MSAVERWRAQCDPRELPAIDALRAIALEAGPGLVESIKWNAPSFAQDGEDRITLGMERKGGVRAVLHRGAARTDSHFLFEDEARLAAWPAPDRGVVKFADAATVERRRGEVTDLFTRWLEAAG
ncbi:DUF1801 domain-containing protein [Altererythrobacter aerius]|uniref:DUF1801 domain-containing protein n=1 Tax=Tsuneonella aeria TaxID=1837929 RepID=A0A6I4TG83_9SPHN|nr:DUF1801 domain-containing protein [Tsuneonella aeria]MXO75674.1 DUF1801 domain-containing protein [Tsuneonella aeria]